jgi:hypothetical protein
MATQWNNAQTSSRLLSLLMGPTGITPDQSSAIHSEDELPLLHRISSSFWILTDPSPLIFFRGHHIEQGRKSLLSPFQAAGRRCMDVSSSRFGKSRRLTTAEGRLGQIRPFSAVDHPDDPALQRHFRARGFRSDTAASGPHGDTSSDSLSKSSSHVGDQAGAHRIGKAKDSAALCSKPS